MLFQSNVENVSPQTIRQVCKELSDLTSDPPEGIKVFPNEEDITEIQASIEGPGIVLVLQGVIIMFLFYIFCINIKVINMMSY